MRGRITFAIAVVVAVTLCAGAGPAAPPPTTKPVIAAAPTSRPAAQSRYEQKPLHSAAASKDVSRIASPATLPAEMSSSSTLDAGRVGIALAIVLGLIFVLRLAAKWMFPAVAAPRSTDAIRLLSRMMISPKQQILLVQVGRRVIVVGDAGSQLRPLSEITDPDEVTVLIGQIGEEQSRASSKTFGSLFGRAKGGFEETSEDDPEEREHDGEPVLAGLTEKVRLLSSQFRR